MQTPIMIEKKSNLQFYNRQDETNSIYSKMNNFKNTPLYI